jgi:type VI secretion system protein ImpA
LELTVKDNFSSFRLSFKALKPKLAEIARIIAAFSSVTLEGIEGGGLPTGNATNNNPAGGGVPDQINSREDVVKTLAKIILFYNKAEPTSPVPIMLERAQRVATMNFKEIVHEFNLTGNPAIQEVLGWKAEEAQF